MLSILIENPGGCRRLLQPIPSRIVISPVPLLHLLLKDPPNIPLVILPSQPRIGEYLIGIANLLEVFVMAGWRISLVLLGEVVVGGLDLVGGGMSIQTQDIVVVEFGVDF